MDGRARSSLGWIIVVGRRPSRARASARARIDASSEMLVETFTVESPRTRREIGADGKEYLECEHSYQTTRVERAASTTANGLSHGENGKVKERFALVPEERTFTMRTKVTVPKVGIMLVGWGGNNGSTLTAAVLANKERVTWRTKEGTQEPNYYGSLTQSGTCRVGHFEGEEVYVPFKSLMPLADPNEVVIGGWDINAANLAAAMERASVLDIDLQRQLRPMMEGIKPRPSAFDPKFVADNQLARANNVIEGSKADQMAQIRADIRDFKEANSLESVVVLWTANTERYTNVRAGVHDTEENLREAIKAGESEISPSTLFALACIDERVPFINGSPQNTFVPGVVEASIRLNSIIGGDDFKTGQTKMKSVLVDYLVGAGLKPTSIVSYNHLGNNDGLNLSAPQTFRSKEISKANVVSDMVESNSILYQKGEEPDHVVVIKYVPSVGDSKRAMDEYTSQIFMNGKNTIVMHNTCEDSLLAAPLILDLCLVAELLTRVEIKCDGEKFHSLHPVAALLSYWSKAPLVPNGMPVVNALAKQRAMLENFFRAAVGLAPENNMLLEYFAFRSPAGCA